MIDTLKKALANHTLCEIYTDTENTNKFAVGYVMSIDEQNLALLSIDSNGRYDGLACLALVEIFEVQTDTKYLQAIEKLIKFHNTPTQKNCPAESVLLNMLLDIKQNRRICQLELCGSRLADINGYIKEINSANNTVELSCVTELGENDGQTIVAMDTISYMSYDEDETIKLEILNN